jgi:hypothetical protein
VIYAIDHVVMAVPAAERGAVANDLLAKGLVEIPLHLEFPEIGAASDSYATAAGSFVELVYETSAGAAPAVWMTEMPRVIGLGFSSDDFEFDIATWIEDAGAWRMDEDHELADGSVLNIRAAGPHPHFESFYVFVMDRSGGVPYRDAGARADLTALTFEGRDAPAWRDRLEGWLRLPTFAGDLRAGGVTLQFRPNSKPGVRVELRLL